MYCRAYIPILLVNNMFHCLSSTPHALTMKLSVSVRVHCRQQSLNDADWFRAYHVIISATVQLLLANTLYKQFKKD
jgi:hypothetical protein